MGRKALISNEIGCDEGLVLAGEVCPLAPALWPFLLAYVDDWGRGDASPIRIKATMVPLFAVFTIPVISSSLDALVAVGKLTFRDVEGKAQIEVVGWLEEQNGGRLPRADWEKLRAEIFARDNYTCAYCGKRGGELACDHRIPVSRGGSNERENLVTACAKCNSSKGAKTIEEWRR